jgi:hypothetical protein
MIQHATLIEKEAISGVKFPRHEVLKNREDILQRNSDLQKAMVLGNMEHNKIRITFETEDGIRVVETTVWAATETEVSLKGGVNIPLHVIYKVSF